LAVNLLTPGARPFDRQLVETLAVYEGFPHVLPDVQGDDPDISGEAQQKKKKTPKKTYIYRRTVGCSRAEQGRDLISPDSVSVLPLHAGSHILVLN
jgi:hypothetical protein